jgi:hypothetical protein
VETGIDRVIDHARAPRRSQAAGLSLAVLAHDPDCL